MSLPWVEAVEAVAKPFELGPIGIEADGEKSGFHDDLLEIVRNFQVGLCYLRRADATRSRDERDQF
jgi:hypothetical protein